MKICTTYLILQWTCVFRMTGFYNSTGFVFGPADRGSFIGFKMVIICLSRGTMMFPQRSTREIIFDLKTGSTYLELFLFASDWGKHIYYLFMCWLRWVWLCEWSISSLYELLFANSFFVLNESSVMLMSRYSEFFFVQRSLDLSSYGSIAVNLRQ